MTRVPAGVFLALALLAACDGIGGPSAPPFQDVEDTTLPHLIFIRYQEDAQRLALRWLQSEEAPGLDEIALPTDLVEDLHQALARVHNATELAARDSVVALYDVHTFPRPDMLRVVLSVDSAAEWPRAWRAGHRLTGNAAIDALMTEWDLRLDSYHDLTYFDDAARLSATVPLNTFALAARFEEIEGVFSAGPGGFDGDGDDITAEANAGAWLLEYSVGFGDCPAGCIGRHFWTFRVHDDGVVEYLGSRGDPPPEPGRR